MPAERQFIPLQIALLTVSDSRTENNDTSGQLLLQRVVAGGHHLHAQRIVPDDIYRIREALSIWIADPACSVVLTTGGTGITGRDGTPEAAVVLFDKTIEGFGEMFRALSYAQIKTSTLQSRALAGVANGTYIFCLPGSPNACATAWDTLVSAQLDYRTRPCNLVELMPRLLER
jgi:molybdenum cofactor biosynthesis protein B